MAQLFKRPRFLQASKTPSPPAELVAEAKRVPGGWVYEIVGSYGPRDGVPPEAIKGAWKVDQSGRLTGEYEPNSRFRSSE